MTDILGELGITSAPDPYYSESNPYQYDDQADSGYSPYSAPQGDSGSVLDAIGITSRPSMFDSIDPNEVAETIRKTPDETVFKSLQRASEERFKGISALQNPYGAAQTGMLSQADKLYRLAKKTYQKGAQALGNIATTNQAMEQQKLKLRHGYLNADHPIGRKMLEKADSETAEYIRNLEEFKDWLPKVEDEGYIYESWPGRLVEDAITGMAGYWPSMVGTIANPAAGYAMASSIIAGERYEQYVNEGKNPDHAWDAALLDAIPGAFVETAGNLFQLKNVKSITDNALKRLGASQQLRNFFKRLRNGMVTEGAEEIAQENWSAVADAYANAPPGSSIDRIIEDTFKTYSTAEHWKNVGWAGMAGGVGGGLFPFGGAVIGGARRGLAKVRGEQIQEARPEEEGKIKGAVEPVPVSRTDEIGAEFGGTPTTGVEFGLTDTTKIIKPGEKEEEVKPVREQQAEATKTLVDKMYGDLNEADLQYVYERLPKQATAIKAEIERRMQAGQKPEGKAYVEPEAKKPEAEEELEIALPEGQGGQLEKAAASLAKTAPGFEESQWQESKTTEGQAVIHRIADALGSKVTFFKAETDSAVGKINGFYSRGLDRIYINENAAAPEMFVLGHESFHELENKHKDLWDKAMLVVRENATAFDEYMERVNADRRKAGVSELSPNEVWREYGSDLAGQAFQNPKFWADLNKRQPDVFKALADIVRKVIQKIKSAFEDKTIHHNIAKEGVKNLEAVEAAIGKAYSEMLQRKGKKVSEGRSAVTEEALERMPRGRKVKITAIHAETGQKIKVEEDAQAAISELDGKIEKYYRVKECIDAST